MPINLLGFRSNRIVANTAKNLYKEINIYDNMLNFFINIGFTSPYCKRRFWKLRISTSKRRKMFLEQIVTKLDTPRKGKHVLSLYGMIYISKRDDAVVRATIKYLLETLDANFVNDFYNELEYYNPNDSIFLPRKNYKKSK